MSDKWDKLSIYDVDFQMEDDDGEVHNFTFKPLPWAYYPKAFNVLQKLEQSGVFDVEKDITDEEFAKHFMSCVGEDIVKETSEVTKIMVSNSYPDLSADKLERFVMANAFQLIDPLTKVITRQSKNKRKADKAMKNG